MVEQDTIKIPFNFGPFILKAGTPVNVLHIDRYYSKAFLEVLDPSFPIKKIWITLPYLEGDRKKEK